MEDSKYYDVKPINKYTSLEERIAASQVMYLGRVKRPKDDQERKQRKLEARKRCYYRKKGEKMEAEKNKESEASDLGNNKIDLNKLDLSKLDLTNIPMKFDGSGRTELEKK